jgi:hypothetical protein
MSRTRSIILGLTAVAVAAFVAACMSAPRSTDSGIRIGSDDIGGAVTSTNGPEAGVWVIAETTDLPTKFAKIVVTDDRGRYLIPDLPKAGYSVWVRGYGLVDSPKVQSTPGRELNLTATTAPTAAAAAEYYPGMYWYSMLTIPGESEFPGTGDKGNGISPNMKAQHYWIDSVKNSCQSCHALGSHGVRVVPPEFGPGVAGWARRTQSGQAMINMALTLGNMGAERALKQYADWTDRIAAGELPFAKPDRPQGVERNVVITEWEWSTPKYYLHDEISTDKRNPTVNANGKIYGSPEESTDLVPVLDPVTNTASSVRHPFRDPATPSSLSLKMQPSHYWGADPLWDGHTSIHNPMMDEQGRMWFTARIRPAANPDFCKAGSSHPSAKVVPMTESQRQLSMYDPKTGKWTLIDTCFTTQHLEFARDANNTLWNSSGFPLGGVVGWLNTKMYFETGDEQKSQGWTPLIVDTNGNGRRDAYVEANQPVDPAKDKRVMAGFYGIMPSTVDDSIWGQTMEVGFTRIDQPGYIIRLVPGPNPTETALAEIYQPPAPGYGPRGIDLDSKGVVWTALSSGHVASFDRSKCRGPLNGPEAASGKLCPEGWTLYRMPGPQFRGVTGGGSANHAYYIAVDRENALGLGRDVPVASANGGEELLADGKFVNIRIPYPLGFFSKNVDGRIDDPNGGWKGRGMWTTFGSRTVFHNEGGTQNRPRAYKVQVRPDPLAD